MALISLDSYWGYWLERDENCQAFPQGNITQICMNLSCSLQKGLCQCLSFSPSLYSVPSERSQCEGSPELFCSPLSEHSAEFIGCVCSPVVYRHAPHRWAVGSSAVKSCWTVRGELWLDLLLSQTAEGWAGTEDVCSPGKPEGAYGSARRPHETAEGKELHLILPTLKQERRERRYEHKIPSLFPPIKFSFVSFPSFFCLGLSVQRFQMMMFLY